MTWKLILGRRSAHRIGVPPGLLERSRPDPQRLPYEKLKVKNLRIDPGGRWISFIINRSYGGFEAFKEIELNDFDADRITGVYRAVDRWGGMRGTGPEYKGSIRLVRYEP